MDPKHTFAATAGHDEVCAAILSIIFEYSLHEYDDTMAQLEVGRPKCLAVIRQFVTAGKKIEMCLPGLPFKSANKTYKVLGRLPDKAEELALARLESICERIESIYPPGAAMIIISDSLIYNGRPCLALLRLCFGGNSRLTLHTSSQCLRP
jgi:pyoverdine/dityrosine biosynthesis protein Dit1